MKNSLTNFTVFFSLVSSLFLAGCSEDDPIEGGEQNANNELVGDLNQDLTLDPSVDYQLTGSYEVLAGNTLTIPAGTTITANEGTGVYIVVHQEADIVIAGTENNPVVMRSKNGAPGDWGGLVILGKGETTEGVNATAEVGGFLYGGTDNSDNSGTIQYLLIEGAGAQINADSQYNGLTLYAVGSGTTINNVALLNGADDGVEFFGGAVSVRNVYLENNEDDSVDWTEGWKGTVTNVYVNHTIAAFSTAVEADGVNNNPQLVNFTAVSATGGTALEFKKESGASFTNLYLEGYTTNISMKDGGALSNVQVDGEAATTDGNYTSGTKVDISTWTWLTAVGL